MRSTFKEINVGELFTMARKLKGNTNEPSIWRKKSSRTAWLESNHGIWAYFGKNETSYEVNNG